jgi:hypothetical protein
MSLREDLMNRSRIYTLLLIAASSLTLIVFTASSGYSADLYRFVDFDGDGFDDNAPDSDSDGIPDEIEFHGFLSAQGAINLEVSAMFSTSNSGSGATESKPCAAVRFGTREFTTRGITSSRADFDAGFGSGLGLSGGQGGGGGCVGGVCF